jgi:hypothetical protein
MNYQLIELVKKMPLLERVTYNGLTYNEVEQRTKFMPDNIRFQYLQNVRSVIQSQVCQINLHEVEICLNANFNLILFLKTATL